MDELTTLLTAALSTTRFQTKTGREISPEQLRSAFSDADGRDSQVRDTLTANPVVDTGQFQLLADCLRALLNPYLDAGTDRVGLSFAVLGDQELRHDLKAEFTSEVYALSSIPNFARSLVRAAGCLGPESAAEVVYGWANGESRGFRVCAVLTGVHIDGSVEVTSGVRLYRLPASSERFPNSIPNADWQTMADMLGRAVLDVYGWTAPAFFRPPPEDEELPTLRSDTALGEVRIAEFLTALSLVCNQRVDHAWMWNDPCETGALTGTAMVLGLTQPRLRPRWSESEMGGITHTPATGVVRLSSPTEVVPNLSEHDVHRVWRLLPELRRRMEIDERFKVAVNRWIEAVSHDVRSMDRLIDLRIALEALYVDSDQGELRFRLAVTGARHLGNCFKERKEIYNSLRSFYDLSSRVVHGVEIGQHKDADVAAIEKATKFCRDGILKIVESEDRPNWLDLLLS